MTKLEKLTADAVRAFYKKQTRIPKDKLFVRHILPRCYVVAKPSVKCLVIACPVADCEPQIRELPQNQHVSGASDVVRVFDNELKTGDWCSVAYISHASGSEPVAVKVVSHD